MHTLSVCDFFLNPLPYRHFACHFIFIIYQIPKTYNVLCFFLSVLFVRSRGCGKADNEGNTEFSKSYLTFPCGQSQIPYEKCVYEVMVAQVGRCWGLHFNQENGRMKKASIFRALVTILSNW